MAEEDSITKKYIGFSPDYMEKDKNPGNDFYNYCNGKWMKETKIPEDKSRYASFDMLYEKNMHLLKHILEDVSKNPKNEMEKQLGDFYKSAMNREILEKMKFSPVEKIIEKIDNSNKEDLTDLMAFLTLNGVQIFFDTGTAEDAKNTDIYALYIGQGGLSLPDRDYYLNDNMKNILELFKKHLITMFELYGYDNEKAKISSEHVLKIEIELAKFSRSKTDLRDVEKAYNKFDFNELNNKYPVFNFLSYFKMITDHKMDYAIIDAPEFFEKTVDMLNKTEMNELKSYFKWKTLRAYAPFLHEEVVNENFNFFRRDLLGQEKIAPRWKTAVSLIDSSIGDSLGKVYVDKHFGKEAMEKITVLVNDIKNTFKERLEKNPWMGEETKEKALKKFSKFTTKIGYPEKFKDYSSIIIDENKLVQNIINSMLYELKRQLSRSGNPVDKTEWFMTPSTVNAYFNPMGNEIVFPAGIMQPPFFDPEMPDAVNYGGIGGVIAHEITHGYDDQGSHFDENGNMVNWWSQEDKKRFDELAEKVVKLYGAVEILPGFNINGKLTLGENIADLGAVLIAYNAFKKRLEAEPEKNKNYDGFTPEQLFFISWGQVWRTKVKENEAKRLATVDPHSPGMARCQLPAWNHPEFSHVFNVNEKHENIVMW